MEKVQELAAGGNYLGAFLALLLAVITGLAAVVWHMIKGGKSPPVERAEDAAPLPDPTKGSSDLDSSKMRGLIEVEVERRVQIRISLLEDEIREPVRALEALRALLRSQQEEIGKLAASLGAAKKGGKSGNS